MTDHELPPDNSSPDQWDAIARFLAGDSTPAESADARTWLAAHPDEAAVVAALDAMLPAAPEAAVSFHTNGVNAFTGPIDVEGALSRVHARMNLAPNEAPAPRVRAPRLDTTRRKPKPASRPIWHFAGMAAAASAVAAVAMSGWLGSRVVTPDSPAVAYDTKVGVRDSIVLPDSSRVILAPGSRLVVSAGYGNGQRDVELTGAAQFTVRHDASRPFTVRAGSALIRDLGTTFAVKAGSVVSVAVTEGSVSLADSAASRQAQAVELRAGDRGLLASDGTVSSNRGAVTPDETSWVTGTVVYRDTPWAEVSADLKRWYGVTLRANVDAATLNSNFSAGESLGDVSKRFAAGVGGVATLRGDTLFIERAGEHPRR